MKMNQNFNPSNKKKVIGIIMQHKTWIILGISFTVINSLLFIPFPYISKIIVDELVGQKRQSVILLCIYAILLILPLQILFPFLRKYFLGKLIRKSGLVLRQSIFREFLQLELPFYQQKGPGYFASRIFGDLDKLIATLFDILIPFIQYLFTFTLGIVFMMLISWRLSILPVLFLPIYWLLNVHLGKKLKKENAKISEIRARFADHFNNIIQSIFSIRIRALENHSRINFLKEDRKLTKQDVELFKVQVKLDSFNSFFSSFVPSGILIMGIYLILKNQMTLGEYVAFSAYTGYMFSAVSFFFQKNINFQSLKVAFERIVEIFEWPKSYEFKEAKTRSIMEVNGVCFESVNFSYNGDKSFGLDNISFSIERGEKVLLMGASGSGKTTILKLILGLYMPDSGKITISKESIKQINLVKLRHSVSFMEQEPLLLNGTIADNISMYKKRLKDKMKSSTILGNAYSFIMKLPKQYESKVEKFGSNFSAGEKQRIVLSSAFYKDSDLFIFDEPTSAIDPEGAKNIIESINKIPRDKTVIISTHYPSFINYADRIIKIEDGRIIENRILIRKKEIVENDIIAKT
jgi:ABC-type bacteriocin/lantibiotic exporter with double-glycine peptidase domain